MNNNRAHKGGQIGKNGLHYDGGQFLPNTELGKLQSKAQQAADRKAREIAQAQENCRKANAALEVYKNDDRLENIAPEYRRWVAADLARRDNVYQSL